MAGPHRLNPRALEASSRRPVVTPWTSDHLVGVVVANGIALMLLIAGWWQASGLGTAPHQLAWLNLSVLGLVVAGAANAMWLARVRRVVTLARGVALPFGPMAPIQDQSPRAPALGSASSNGHGPAQLIAGPGMSFYHRATCQMVAGKETQVASRGDHEEAGRRPCEVCWP
jgi:hypothetical protein